MCIRDSSYTINYKSYDKEIGNGIANFGPQIAQESIWEVPKLFWGRTLRPPYCQMSLCPPPQNFIKPWFRSLLGIFWKKPCCVWIRMLHVTLSPMLNHWPQLLSNALLPNLYCDEANWAPFSAYFVQYLGHHLRTCLKLHPADMAVYLIIHAELATSKKKVYWMNSRVSYRIFSLGGGTFVLSCT